MPKDFRNHLTKQIGEHLVVAELGRRGIVAAPFAGNVPDIDILAYADGRTVAIQVKTLKTGSVQVDAKSFLNIRFDGETQIIDGLTALDRDLIFVLVCIDVEKARDRFFVFTQGELQDLIFINHTGALDKHGGRRPRNWQSTHCAYGPASLSNAENSWDLIERRLGMIP
jgi:Holliday junction resolvase